MSARGDGPDVMGECELAYMPGRAVTSRASSGCATGQCKRRSSFVSVAECKYELDVPSDRCDACAPCAEQLGSYFCFARLWAHAIAAGLCAFKVRYDRYPNCAFFQATTSSRFVILNHLPSVVPIDAL